jgi:hypothetical protein
VVSRPQRSSIHLPDRVGLKERLCSLTRKLCDRSQSTPSEVDQAQQHEEHKDQIESRSIYTTGSNGTHAGGASNQATLGQACIRDWQQSGVDPSGPAQPQWLKGPDAAVRRECAGQMQSRIRHCAMVTRVAHRLVQCYRVLRPMPVRGQSRAADNAARVVRDQTFIAPQTRLRIHCTKVSANTFVQSATALRLVRLVPRTAEPRPYRTDRDVQIDGKKARPRQLRKDQS